MKENTNDHNYHSLHASLHVTDLADAMKIISSFSKIQSRGNTHNDDEAEDKDSNNNNRTITA